MQRLFPLLIPLLLFSLPACSRDARRDYVFNRGMIFGTLYHFTYASPGGEDLQGDIKRVLENFSRSLSNYDPQSTISRVNKDDPAVVVDDYFEICFRAAQEIAAETDGAFDMTVGGLVNAWGFGFEKRKEITPELIEDLLRKTGHEKVRLVDGKVVKDIPGIVLDSNAIAKGFAADVVARFLTRKGCEHYMVEIGGEVVARGRNPKNRAWNIGISKPIDALAPEEREIQTVVKLKDAALATSGNYRNYYVKDGKKYAHTIDPGTGYPVEHSLLSATVIASDCMTADAYATAFMVMGTEKARAFVEARGSEGVEALLVYADQEGKHRTWSSPGFGK